MRMNITWIYLAGQYNNPAQFPVKWADLRTCTQFTVNMVLSRECEKDSQDTHSAPRPGVTQPQTQTYNFIDFICRL